MQHCMNCYLGSQTDTEQQQRFQLWAFHLNGLCVGQEQRNTLRPFPKNWREKWIKDICMKKLRALYIWGMLETINFELFFFLPVWKWKGEKLKCCWLSYGSKIWSLQWGNNVDWDCLVTQCWAVRLHIEKKGYDRRRRKLHIEGPKMFNSSSDAVRIMKSNKLHINQVYL